MRAGKLTYHPTRECSNSISPDLEPRSFLTRTCEGETEMRRNRLLAYSFTIITALGIISQSGCANTEEGKSPVAANPAANSAGGKIPITTSSEAARKEFLQGRDLN